MKQAINFFVIFSAVFMLNIFPAMAESNAALVEGQEFSQDVVINLIKDYLKEKAKYTGKVDLYDEKINKVRNLDLLEMGKDLTVEGNQYSTQGKFRDVSSGDIVSLKIVVDVKGGKLDVPNLLIENVDKNQAVNTSDPNRQFTDQDVKDVIGRYLKQKSQFTGTFDMYDEKTQKMLKLEIGVTQENIRKFGTRYIGRVDALEKSANEKIELDISVDNKDGVLEVKSVKIYSINNVQR